jgi:hypothetical protein
VRCVSCGQFFLFEGAVETCGRFPQGVCILFC